MDKKKTEKKPPHKAEFVSNVSDDIVGVAVIRWRTFLKLYLTENRLTKYFNN